jgi:hypothetical protein
MISETKNISHTFGPMYVKGRSLTSVSNGVIFFFDIHLDEYRPVHMDLRKCITDIDDLSITNMSAIREPLEAGVIPWLQSSLGRNGNRVRFRFKGFNNIEYSIVTINGNNVPHHTPCSTLVDMLPGALTINISFDVSTPYIKDGKYYNVFIISHLEVITVHKSIYLPGEYKLSEINNKNKVDSRSKEKFNITL